MTDENSIDDLLSKDAPINKRILEAYRRGKVSCSKQIQSLVDALTVINGHLDPDDDDSYRADDPEGAMDTAFACASKALQSVYFQCGTGELGTLYWSKGSINCPLCNNHPCSCEERKDKP